MIYIASDHFGIRIKRVVLEWLNQKAFHYEEFGSKTEQDEKSIAEFIPLVAQAVLKDRSHRGIMICGTGIGVDIGANRFKGIRSVLASTPKIAEWSRLYDNSNVLCLSGWDSDPKVVEDILKAWFTTEFKDDDGTKSAFLAAMDKW